MFPECISALAPASITCAAALAEEGLNPIADAACFASALNNISNPVCIRPFGLEFKQFTDEISLLGARAARLAQKGWASRKRGIAYGIESEDFL